jgi:hypothetical protein
VLLDEAAPPFVQSVEASSWDALAAEAARCRCLVEEVVACRGDFEDLIRKVRILQLVGVGRSKGAGVALICVCFCECHLNM